MNNCKKNNLYKEFNTSLVWCEKWTIKRSGQYYKIHFTLKTKFSSINLFYVFKMWNNWNNAQLEIITDVVFLKINFFYRVVSWWVWQSRVGRNWAVAVVAAVTMSTYEQLTFLASFVAFNEYYSSCCGEKKIKMDLMLEWWLKTPIKVSFFHMQESIL